MNHGEEESFGGEAVRSVEVSSSSAMHDLVQASEMNRVLLSYGSDATSLKFHVQVRASVSGKSVVRKGKDLIEFLLRRGFAKSITSSG